MARLYTILKFMTVLLISTVLFFYGFVQCAQVDPGAPREVRVSTLPLTSTVELEIRTLTDLSTLLQAPECSLSSAIAWWSGTGKDWASVYLGESKTPSDAALVDARLQALVQLMDAVRPHAAMLTSGILSLGVGAWQSSSKSSKANWLFDYSATGLPWSSKVDLKFTKKPSGEKSLIRIATRTEGFRPDLPLFLDYPNRRVPQILKMNRIPEDISIKTLTVAHADEINFLKLGPLAKNHWGVVVTDAKNTASLEAHSWVPLRPSVPLARILLYSGGGLRIEPMRCESVPLVTPRSEVARVVENFERVRKAKNVATSLGTLKESLDWAEPDAVSEKPSVGYWLADVLRNSAHADFAFIPTYGLSRNSLSKGELSRSSLWQSFPINEKLFLVDISGADILKALNSHVDLWTRDGAFPFFYSGRTVEVIRSEPAEARVRTQIQREQFYKVMTYESVLKTKSPSEGFNLPGVATPLRLDVHQAIEIFLRRTKGAPQHSKLGVSALKAR